MLPTSKPSTTTVHLTGGPVQVRGLTIAEIRECRQHGTTMEADAAWIHYATGDDPAHILLWIKGGTHPETGETVVPALGGDVTRLLYAIWEASGMTEDARFQGGTTDDAGSAGTGE